MAKSARPILKWAGGKSRLVEHIVARLPNRIATYYEPFAGGAAVFFKLAAEGRFERAVLSDRNEELIDLYRVIQGDVESVIAALEKHRKRHCEKEYYRVRALLPAKLAPTERAARLIYLNKTGYNGLFRVNRSGQFNVPFGRYKNPNICDAENLRAAARALEKARIEVADFEAICEAAETGDAVYFDPPYDPVSRTSSFTAYYKEPFDEHEHRRLARLFRRLASRGVALVLSNSDTPLTRELYRPKPDECIGVSRPINSRVSGRGNVGELLLAGKRPRRSSRKLG